MDRNVNNGVNNNIFDITNLDLYYGIKTSRKDNVSHAHIDVDFCRPDCKNNKMICHPELVSGSYRTALPHKTVQSERRSDLLIRQNILPHKTVQANPQSQNVERRSELLIRQNILPFENKRPSNIISAAEYLKEKRLREQNIAVLKQQSKKNKPSKLAVASLAIALSMFMTPAIADEPIPTLDKLHQDGIINPSTMDKDDEGNPIEGTGEVYPESAYNLTPAEQQGENTITLYEKEEITKYYDPTTGEEVQKEDLQEGIEYKEITTIETTPKYYTVTLKQTEYGTGNGAKYFKWDTSSGSLKLTEVTDPSEAQITAKYDTSLETVTKTIDNGTVTNPSGTSSSKPYQFDSGAGLNNPEGPSTSIDNKLFINNKVTGTLESTTSGSKYAEINGGAVHNEGEITSITGDFVNNGIEASAQKTNGYTYIYAYGGAISNSDKIGNITGDFIGNYASGSNAYGGAIYNSYGTIGNITGDFIGNYVSGYNAYGGAIYNNGSNAEIGDITGDFIGNYVSGSNAYGGAIYNSYGTIGNITGDFIGNYVYSSGSVDYGGAICNSYGTIGDITGDFIGNYASGFKAYSGAIYNNNGTIGDITGDFIGNYASDSVGAIHNYNGTIGNITGDFIGNYASVYGGAIRNYNGTIGNITGDFIGNYASVYGGAIYSDKGTIGDITGDFIGNYASATDNYANGGAISNSAGATNATVQIGNITGDFIGNYVSGYHAYGGAIYNNAESSSSTAQIGDITGDFIGNYAYSSGSAARGGAIYNYVSNAEIGNITGDFISNYAASTDYEASGGAIYNAGEIGNITGDFIGNYASGSYARGGAIYNTNSGAEIMLTDSSFKNSYAVGQTAQGGAIYNENGTVNIIADKKDVIFDGNFSASSQNPDGTFNDKKSDAIYMLSGTLNLNAQNSDIIFNDTVTAKDGTLTISGKNGVYFNNNLDLILDTMTVEGGTVGIKGDTNNLSIDSTTLGTSSDVTLDMSNGKSSELSLGNLTLNSDLNLKIDADLSAGTSDSLNVDSLISIGHALNIEDINITSDLEDKDYVVSEIVNSLIDVNINETVDAYLTSNYKYDIDVLEAENNEYLVFKKEGANLGLPFAIKEQGNVVYSMTEDETINSSWFVSSDISSDKFTLNGNGHTITSSDGKTQGLVLGAGKELNIDNVKEISGFVSQSGGAINAAGALNIANSTISNNTAQTQGGALNISPSGSGEISGMITGSQVSYKDQSLTAFVPKQSMAVSDGLNLVLISKMEIPDDTPDGDAMFEQYKTQFNEMIQSGEAVGSVNDLPAIPSDPALTEAVNQMLEEMNSQLVQMTVTYEGEVLGTYIQNPMAGQGGMDMEFGLVSMGGQTSGDVIEYTIKDTLFENNKVSNPSGNAYGGAVSIQNNPIDISSILKPTDMGSVDISTEVSSKEEALAMLEQMVQSGELITSMDDFMSDEFTVSAEDPKVTFINTSFVNNSAVSETGEAKGGAIYANTDLTIKADNGTSLFKGNTANGESNAIYLDNANKTLTLETVNSGTIQFDDKIDGQTGYKVKITGDDEKSQVVFNNNVDNAVVNSENVTVTLNNNETFKNSDFTINSGTINLINNNTQQQYAKSFNITGPINLNLDADLAAKSMDRLPENTTVSESGKINVNNINLLSDATQDITQILFAHDSYKDKVDHIGPSELSTATQTTQLFAPIYKYNVSYNPEDGMFTFVRGAGAPSNSFEAFNPAVVAPTVATQAGAYTTQLQTFNYAFQHADTFMNIPYLERVSIINANKYALSPTADATDVGTFSPLLTKSKDPGFWVKPYASFESIPLDNGPKVSNINYGTLVGYDSPITSISNGWERVITGYVGYNGASQRYQGVDNYQNGGILGGTTTFYKGNFFNATTLSVGASVGDTTTMYGSENYTMLLAGIGNKTGYNFEFKEGKYIIQPAMLISYTFVNTFDYTNAAGLRIESDPLHALQLAPGIKFIMNTKNGWQPYIGVNMIWNLLDDSKVTANDVRLPEMSIKPYVQYGIGVQKRFNDTFMAYGQAMIHNGGRNGISFSAGLRWKVGRKEK